MEWYEVVVLVLLMAIAKSNLSRDTVIKKLSFNFPLLSLPPKERSRRFSQYRAYQTGSINCYLYENVINSLRLKPILVQNILLVTVINLGQKVSGHEGTKLVTPLK